MLPYAVVATQRGRGMEYRDSADISGAQVTRAGGGGGGGGRMAVGGIGGLILLVLGLIFGFNPSSIMGADPGAAPQPQAGNPVTECTRGSDVAKNRDCRWQAYMSSIGGYWSGALRDFRPAPLVIFSQQVSTGCGAASSEVGPFYCPADEKIYLDTEFTAQLLRQLGARGGDAAEAYIIAHEYGHHIQNLTGTMAQVQAAGQQTGPSSPQVRLELQADCYAGVWFKHSTEDPNGAIKAVSQDDLNRIVDAAKAVGDDRIQQSSSGRVSPESWTHGSAAQRKYWVAKGFNTGDPRQCDTFSTNQLGA